MVTVTKESKYVERYYRNNYGHGQVDEEINATGLFVAENAEGRVLDCGCGPVPQLYAIFMPKMKELYAIDLPQESIDFVKEKISSVNKWYKKFILYQKVIENQYGVKSKDYILQQVAKIKGVEQADMSVDIPFGNEYFDTVISFFSLGCLSDEEELRKAVFNIKRVLKPDGQLLHINTDGTNSNTDLPAYTWRGLDQTPRLIKDYLESAGFSIVSEKRVDLPTDGHQMYKYSQVSLLKAKKG